MTTGASSATMDIALTSAALSNPYFTVFTTPDCNTYTSINCTQGAAGSASANVPVSINTTYLIAISDQAGATGNFDLCITVNNDNSACNTTNSLTVSATSMGSPLTGPFQPGEIVTFCYSITNFQQINCNYLQGIVPTFGDCWDPVSMNAQGQPLSIPTPLVTAGTIQPCPPGPPCPWDACAGTPAGTWSWFPAGAVTYNAIGGSLPDNSPMPAGWYFLSSYNPLTGACTGDPTDPDNSYGDSDFNSCASNTLDWSVCFQLQARGIIACTNGQTDCSVKVNTYADGEIGVWTDIGCTADATGASFLAANLCCTAAPAVSSPVTYCIDDVASQLTATGSGLLWYSTATGGVGSATAPTPSTTTVGSTNYWVSSLMGGCESARVIISVTVNSLPTITGTLTVCVGLTTQLTGSAPTAGGSWSSASTGIATVNSSGLVTGVSAGTSIITYTNGNGCAITATVTVNSLPTITGTLTVCVGLTTQLTGSAPTVGGSWSSASTGIATVNSSGLVTGVSAGTSIITYTNGNGCVITATVTVNTLPTISGTLTVCAGLTTQLTGSAPTAGSSWSSASIGIATVNSSGLVTGVSAGTSIITYTNGNGCVITETITVNPLPVISGTATITLASCGISNGTITGLTATGLGTLTYTWSNAVPAIVSASTVTGDLTGQPGGSYTLVVTTDANSCSSSAGPFAIGNSGAPAAPTATSPSAYCQGATIADLTATGTGGTLTWYSDPGLTTQVGTGSPFASGATATSTFYVTETVSGCSSLATAVTITVNPAPIASFTTSPDPATGSEPLVVGFTNTSQNANTYSWVLGNSNTSASQNPPNQTYSIGTYTVVLTASDNTTSCTSTASAIVVVYEDYSILIPNVFTPNADGHNDIFKVTSTGIESLAGSIYDRWGAKIFEWNEGSGGWDGRTTAGMTSTDGTYYYILTVKASDTKEYIYNGYLQLLR